MNRDYAETYEEHKSGKYEYVKGFGRLGCYQGLDYIENILKNDKYYSEELEDNFIFIQSYINYIEHQCKKQKEVIDMAKSLNHEISHTIYEDFLEENIIGSKFLYERIKKQLSILEDKEVSE